MGSLPELLPAYRGLKTYSTEEGRGAFLRLDLNEGPSPELDALSELLSLCAFSVTVYPDYGPLKRAAAQAWGLSPEMLLPVNGADEGIALLLRALCDPGTPLVLPVPAFPMYPLYARLSGAPVIAVPLDAEFQVDVPATAAAIREGGVLALTSPNNPTGRALPEGALRGLLEAAKGRPVLLDETYAPFCGQDYSPLLAEFPNLVILRTLSKAFGVPGLRCGLLVADPQFIAALDPLRSPFNVNGVAAQLGAQLLAGDPGRPARLNEAVAARRELQAELEGMGLPCVPSDTHFFLAQFGPSASEAVQALRQRGILVKDLSAKLPGLVRISVARRAEAQAFLEAFRPWISRQFDRSCP